MSVHYVSTAHTEARRRHWIPWDWDYRQLWVTMWVIGVKIDSFGRAAIVLNLQTNYSALNVSLLNLL